MYGAPALEHEVDELEEAGTALLRAAGCFERGTGVRSPRSMAEARYGCHAWSEWHDREIAHVGAFDLWTEIDAVAAAARLSPREKAILSMSQVEEYTLREMADLLGSTVHHLRVCLQSALRKCRSAGLDGPLSPSSLFWEEIQQKTASIYRRPIHSWRVRRTVGDER
jgi:hypothetical protein